MVSIEGQRFFRTVCWWRAERSDSPPGGKACQYFRFALGQFCAELVELKIPRKKQIEKDRKKRVISFFIIQLQLVHTFHDGRTIAPYHQQGNHAPQHRLATLLPKSP
jgi:hypothetical protein